MTLQGKVALVTGSTSGIGLAIARAFAAEGAAVMINGFGDAGEIEAIRAGLEQASGAAAIHDGADLADAAAIEAMVARCAAELGGPDILVNNAGVTRDGLLVRMKEEDWNLVMQVNLNGTFHCTKAVIQPMSRQRYGRIVNIASIVGVMGNAGQANYAASEAAVIGFTKTIAREYASRLITVNAVAPGFITGRWLEGGLGGAYEPVKKAMEAKSPLGRVADPEDVSDAIVSLICGSDMVTGVVLPVEGGMLIAS